MKLLITGVNGFVAGSVMAHAKGKWEIHGIGRSENMASETGLIYHQLDLQDSEKLAELFNEIRPDAVIHTAAMANIDTCQKNQELAEQSNVNITQTIAGLCQEHGAKMVF